MASNGASSVCQNHSPDSFSNKKRKLSHDLKISPQDYKEIETQKNEKQYFSSYSDLELHRTMIEDQVRTNSYRDAILHGKEEFIKGKVVVDVGCGTGILSVFCAQAGAKKVYAIDASDIARLAKRVVNLNGLNDKIEVIQGKAEDVELPEKVDVIVSEWMGYMLLYETMLPSVLYVRDKWLKPGGKIFPERAVLYLAMAEAHWITKYEENTYDFWISINHLYNIDMTNLADHAVSKYNSLTHIHMIGQEDIGSLPTVVRDFDLYTMKTSDLASIEHTFTLSSFGSRRINCLALWFDVWFPGGKRLSTSPDMEDTHWQNTILPLKAAYLRQDSTIDGAVKIIQDKSFHRYLDIDLEYCYDKGEKVSQLFKMDDNCSDE